MDVHKNSIIQSRVYGNAYTRFFSKRWTDVHKLNWNSIYEFDENRVFYNWVFIYIHTCDETFSLNLCFIIFLSFLKFHLVILRYTKSVKMIVRKVQCAVWKHAFLMINAKVNALGMIIESITGKITTFSRLLWFFSVHSSKYSVLVFMHLTIAILYCQYSLSTPLYLHSIRHLPARLIIKCNKFKTVYLLF